jgi:hypothetical protein
MRCILAFAMIALLALGGCGSGASVNGNANNSGGANGHISLGLPF